MKHGKTKQKCVLRRVLRLPDIDHAKLSVLNTLRSPESERAYRFAIDDFISWYCSEPRIAFNKTVVLRYKSNWGQALDTVYHQSAIGGGPATGL